MQRFLPWLQLPLGSSLDSQIKISNSLGDLYPQNRRTVILMLAATLRAYNGILKQLSESSPTAEADSHLLHTRTCLLTSPEDMKCFSQYGQEYGFSPVCILVCLVRSELLLKPETINRITGQSRSMHSYN